MELQSPLAAEKDIHLEGDIPPDLPLVWADAVLIERVLQNLVGNAIKFTPSGGVIGVTTRIEAKEQDRLPRGEYPRT